jgi:hypothetical protein
MHAEYMKDTTVATLGFMMAHAGCKRFFTSKDLGLQQTLYSSFIISLGVQMLVIGVRGWDS